MTERFTLDRRQPADVLPRTGRDVRPGDGREMLPGARRGGPPTWAPAGPAGPAGPPARLAGRMAPTIVSAVDELHVAAVLESMGVTDSAARRDYGQADVFALATAMYRWRPAIGLAAGGDGPAVPARSRGAWWVLSHGPLYVLPSTLYPAVLIALGHATTFRTLVFTSALGWVWGMGMSAVAYQFVGRGLDRSAARAFRLLGPVGIAIALLAGTVFAVTGPGGAGLAAFAGAQMTFQLASGVLVFYGKEIRVAAAMLPAFAAGIAFLASGSAARVLTPALVIGALCIAALAVTAWVTAGRAPTRSGPGNPVPVMRMFTGTGPSLCYAALCALYFLNSDARFLAGEFDLAISAMPLILGMGALEWRALRFTEKVGQLFNRPATSAEFRRAAWRLLLAELANCLIVLGGLAAVFMLVLTKGGLLSGQGSLLVDAYVLLGGAYFLGFIMARHQQYARLLGIMCPVVVAEVLLADRIAPQAAVQIFLLSIVVLLILQIVMLRVSFQRIYRYQ